LVIVLTDLQNAITNLNLEIYEKRPYIPAVYQKGKLNLYR
jgi:hypothetical protein